MMGSEMSQFLFDDMEEPKAPVTQVWMDPVDSDERDGQLFIVFRCRKCETETEWEPVADWPAARRGIVCEDCTEKRK